MSVRTRLAVLAASIAVTAFAAPTDPTALVKGLYAHEATPTHVEGLFAADLAGAYRKDTGHPGEVGAIDFDWRYDAQDVKITDLHVYALPQPPTPPGSKPEAMVAADFKNFGKAGRVFYRLCQTPAQQWRVADVSSKNGKDSWSLRALLHLDPVKVSC